MTDNDYNRFTAAMLGMAKASVNRCDRLPDDDEIMIRFKFLKDLSFEQIIENGKRAMRKNSFFPGIPELAGESSSDNQNEAIEAYETIVKLLKQNYNPNMSIQGMAVRDELEKMGKSDWVPMLSKWAWNIQNSTNSGVTRKQFIDSFNAQKSKQIDEKVLKLGENKQKLIEG